MKPTCLKFDLRANAPLELFDALNLTDVSLKHENEGLRFQARNSNYAGEAAKVRRNRKPTRIHFALLAASTAWLSLTAPAVAQKQILNSNGWIIFENADSSLSIESDLTGQVAHGLKLTLKTPLGLVPLSKFNTRSDDAGRLFIDTIEPATSWVITAESLSLNITSTSFDGVVTGLADTSNDRTVARLLDPQGQPVIWSGVNEIAETYGGRVARNVSYLPSKNPDVSYLGLGHVGGAGLHSLFDASRDIAIDFGDASDLQVPGMAEHDFMLTMPVKAGVSLKLIPDYYIVELGVPFYQKMDDSHFPTAPSVWSSWTSYFEDVSESDIVRNADWLSSHLKDYGFQYIQLDDGYDRTPEGHAWIGPWDPTKFPHGAKWVANYIHAKGLKAGLWLVPNTDAANIKAHPDWYLYDKQGKVLLDYGTPALDSTNPNALNRVEEIFAKLDEEGFEYYKLDGEQALPAYAPEVDKSRLFAKNVDYILNYRRRLESIRAIVGPDRFLEFCPMGTPLNGIGIANSYFNGDDLYNNWQGMYSLFSAINNNLFLNHLVTYVMPGEGIELGEPMSLMEATEKRLPITIEMERKRENPATGFGTTMPEARTIVSIIALTGVVYPLASIMPELPASRVDLLRKTMPTLPIRPIDLFSRGSESSWDKFKHVTPDTYIHHYPDYIDLKVNSAAGLYDVVAATNWRSQPSSRRLMFNQKLGLPTDKTYAVFDFWNQKPIGRFKTFMDLKVNGYDTRVFQISAVNDRPQLIGNSRHISGTFSIRKQEWEERKSSLNGVSDVIHGAPYSLWVYTPKGFSASSVLLTDGSERRVQAKIKNLGDFAQVTFIGTQSPMSWAIQFRRPPTPPHEKTQ